VALRTITFAEALNEAQRLEMRRDPEVIVFGENVTSSWRAATKGLLGEFGRERVRDAPITETAFIGAGGLGEFINRGLSLDNPQLIVLGAVPAAALALFVDFAIWQCGPGSSVAAPRRLVSNV